MTLSVRSFVLLLFVVCLAAFVSAQTTTTITTGLNHPNKVILAPSDSLLVAEGGTSTANTGRISVVDRTTGDRHTLISGLPSALSTLGGEATPDGPSGLHLRGNTLWVTIGVGDAVLPGGGPGLEVPNATPSSPLFTSVLEFTLPGGYTSWASGFEMTMSDQEDLAAGDTIKLTNDQGHAIVVRVVADLPNYIFTPPPTPAGNVKASHLYGVEQFQTDLYIVDSGLNRIHRVGIRTGDVSTLTTFPNRPNPSFPTIGGPFIEAVPDNIHRFGNRLLVPLLTGFPFVSGLAEVRAVDIKSGEHVGLIPNLTSAIDIVKAEDPDETPSLIERKTVLSRTKLIENEAFAPGDNNAFYTLEFSTNLLGGALGRLRYYSDPTATPVNVVTTLVTPTSMARDGYTGNLFITNIGPGTVTKVAFP